MKNFMTYEVHVMNIQNSHQIFTEGEFWPMRIKFDKSIKNEMI